MLDSSHNLVVARASAEIPGNVQPDVVLAGIGHSFQQGLGRHDEAGCTETALQSPVVYESLLNGMQRPTDGHALNGRNLMAVRLKSQGETGIDSLAVELDGAGTAVPVAATPL